jgi:hypothetical protein
MINKLRIKITRCSGLALLLRMWEVRYLALDYQLDVIYPQSLCALLLTERNDSVP